MNLLNAASPMQIAILIIICLCLLGLVITMVLLIINYLKRRNKRDIKTSNSSFKNIDESKIRNEIISEISGMSVHEIQKYIYQNFEDLISRDTLEKIEKYKAQSNAELEEVAKSKIIDAMEEVVTDVINQTKTDIEISDDLVGRFIGKDGMNIKTIEKITECQVSIVDKNLIRVSSFNSLRKELCIRLINKLIKAKTFDRNRIEKNFESLCSEMNEELKDIGKKTLVELGIHNVNPGLYKYIGRLKYRTSYSQNVLSHSIESAKLAASIGQALELDSQICKECAFFHDVGKSVDYEQDGNHVKSGIELAKKYGLNKYIINAIMNLLKHLSDKG